MNKIIIADDHKLICTAIEKMIGTSDKYNVTHKVHSGKELLRILKIARNIPDMILLDINMPVMDGYATMEILHKEYPAIKVLVLSMNDDEDSFLKMIRLGAHGFVSKSADEDELHQAIESILSRGCYYSREVSDALFRAARNSANQKSSSQELTNREKELLGYIGTEMTYSEIADRMFLSPKTIDGYRSTLFQKLNTKSRVGLVVYAIKHGYHTL